MDDCIPANAPHRSIKSKPAYKEATVFFLLALLLRVTWTLLIPNFDPLLKDTPLRGDAGSYDRIAQNLMSGLGYREYPSQPTAFWPPLYPWFLNLVYQALGYHIAIARLVQAVLGSLVPFFFYLIAMRLSGRTAARMTGLGLVFYPHLIYFGAWLIAEALFMALLSTAFWFASRLPDRWQPSTLIALGVMLALCALVKPTALFFLPLLGLWVFCAPFNLKLSRRLGLASLLGLCTLLVILPWTFRNYRLFHQIVLISTNGGYTFLGANHPNAWGGHEENFPKYIPGLNDAEMEDAYYSEGMHWIRSNPGNFLRLLPVKYFRLVSPLSIASQRQDFPMPYSKIIYIIYAAFLFVGILGMVLDARHWRRNGFLYSAVVGVLLSTGIYYGDARYTIPMIPAIVYFACLGLIWVGQILKRLP